MQPVAAPPPRYDTVSRRGTTYTRRARSTATERDEHGTVAAYNAGCRCPQCQRARRRYDRAWWQGRQLARTGTARRRIDPRPAAAAIATLRANGWTIAQVADAAGCSTATIDRITRIARRRASHKPQPGRCWSDIAERLEALAADA